MKIINRKIFVFMGVFLLVILFLGFRRIFFPIQSKRFSLYQSEQVFISNVKIDGDSSSHFVSDDGQSIVFSLNGSKFRDSTVTYQVINQSKNDVYIKMSCEFSKNSIYSFKDKSGEVFVGAKEVSEGSFSLDVLKSKNNLQDSLASLDSKVSCTMKVSPVVLATTCSGTSSKNLFDIVKSSSRGLDKDNSINYNHLSNNSYGVYETKNTNEEKSVYFFRGNVADNHVLFNEMCFRIVRTTESGGVKLIYNGKSDKGTCHSSDNFISESVWNDAGDDNRFLGYMYGESSGSYDETHKNSYDSSVKKVIDEWYEKNFVSSDFESLIGDDFFCNDREIAKDLSSLKYSGDFSNISEFNSLGYLGEKTIYQGAIRRGVGGFLRPSLSCSQKNNQLKKNDGSLKYPVGLLTADEAVYAGDVDITEGRVTTNKNSYLYSDGRDFWTMTPGWYLDGAVILTAGGDKKRSFATEKNLVRPVISLTSAAVVVEGDGTASKPFVIEKPVVTKEKVTPFAPSFGKGSTNSAIVKKPAGFYDNGIFSRYYNKAYSILQQMSLKEKIGQLFIVRYSPNTIGDAISNYHVCGTTFYAVDFSGKSVGQVQYMTSSIQSRSKIPLITAVDEEGGSVIRVSKNPSLVSSPFRASKDLYDSGGFALVSQDTINKSAVLRNLGINMNFAPVVDIADPTSYIYSRTVGYGADVTGEYARTVISASKGTGVSYSLKHFPGYGNNQDTHSVSSTDNTTLDEFYNKHLVPFVKGIGAGAETVMISHNIVAAIDGANPASLSRAVHNVLFSQLGFTGIAITDDLDMAGGSVYNKYTRALLAGNHIILLSRYQDAQAEILRNINNGVITEDYINNLVFKVLAWKCYKGLL